MTPEEYAVPTGLASAETTRSKARALALLGIARRAGALERGTGSTQRAVRDGRARLVLLAADASDVQTERVLRLLRHRDTPRMTLGSRHELGAAVGAALISAVAVTEAGLAGRLVDQLSGQPGTSIESDRGR